jgi:hypothetical protein
VSSDTDRFSKNDTPRFTKLVAAKADSALRFPRGVGSGGLGVEVVLVLGGGALLARDLASTSKPQPVNEKC